MVTTSIVIRDETRKHFITQKIEDDLIVELDDETISVTKDTRQSAQAQLVFARKTETKKAGPTHVQQAALPSIVHRSVVILLEKNTQTESILGQGSFGIVKKCLLNGAKGWCVKVPLLPHGKRRLTSDDQTLLLKECMAGYTLRHTDRFVHTKGLWVDTKGVGQGIVMQRYRIGVVQFITKMLTQKTTLSDGWQVDFLKWITEEYVRAVLEAHRLGVTLGDIKLGNAGLSACPSYVWQPIQETPWIGQILQICDFGLAGESITNGSFMHRPRDFSSDPASEILGQHTGRDSDPATLRRNDWFQVAMTIFDAAHRVCGTWLNAPECWGLDSQDVTKKAVRQIAKSWASTQSNPCSPESDKLTGWLVYLVTNCAAQVPGDVRTLFEREELKDIDRRLTRNFQTSM